MLYTVILILVLQRFLELLFAKRNEIKIKKLGGYEVGRSHYKMIVSLHVLFFLSLIIEGRYKESTLDGWGLLLILFLLLQVMRVWTIHSLGMFWNTRILILPGANPVTKGPYKWIKHPNYLIVILELLIIPFMFHAYFTAVTFTILNLLLLLKIRIPQEEQALKEATNYTDILGYKKRFLP